MSIKKLLVGMLSPPSADAVAVRDTVAGHRRPKQAPRRG